VLGPDYCLRAGVQPKLLCMGSAPVREFFEFLGGILNPKALEKYRIRVTVAVYYEHAPRIEVQFIAQGLGYDYLAL